jgi:tetratricopeptide (TPR) repeat protein
MRLRTFALLGVLVAAGCASTSAPTLASRFVRQGTPSIDLGGPRPAFKAPPPPRPPLADATITGNVARTSSASSLESFDPDLRTALARLTFAPTVAHHLDVARAYRRQGIFDQAYDYLTRSLNRNGPEPIVLDERARLWRDWGHPGLGLADAHRAAYLEPRSPVFKNTLGTLLYEMGRTHEAEDQFQQALALDPNAWYALANLCYVNVAQGRTLAAIPLCKKASALRAKQEPAPPTRQKTGP